MYPVGDWEVQIIENWKRTLKPIFSVPCPRDPKFIDRAQIFSRLEEQLESHNCASLYGLGGNGKSQIAIEYAYRFVQSQPKSHVFWIYAANSARFVRAYQDIARTLQLPGYDDPKTDPCELVTKWLNQEDSGHWLMILDNADDANLFFSSAESKDSSTTMTQHQKPLINYVPKMLNPRRLLMVTTRNRRVGEDLTYGEPGVEVSQFSIQEATELLLKIGSVDQSDLSGLARLLDILGCIPLAIAQAAAFMRRNRMPLHKYLVALGENEQNLMDHLSTELQDHRRENGFPNSVFRTWKLSFDQIRMQEPDAAKILSLAAMLDRNQIPEDLIRPVDGNDVEFTNAIGVLDAFSLITKELGEETFAMHRLVQLSLCQWLEQGNKKEDCVSQVLELLAEKFPNGQYEYWGVCERLLPHAQKVLEYECISKDDRSHRATLLVSVSRFNMEQGRYDSAHQTASEAYDIRQRLFGKSAFVTIESLNRLARVLFLQGKYKAAEKMNMRALREHEKMLGVEHPFTLTSVTSLASVLDHQGRYEAAEKMSIRALTLREKILGAEHLDTLTSVNNLASVLDHQGKYEAAEEMYLRALRGYEKMLGAEHPGTLITVNNLAAILDHQGNYEAAEKMYLRALKGHEKVLGAEHPDTLTTVNNLAIFFYEQGNYEVAEEMYLRALNGREKTLGADHPKTLATAECLNLLRRNKDETAKKRTQQAPEERGDSRSQPSSHTDKPAPSTPHSATGGQTTSSLAKSFHRVTRSIKTKLSHNPAERTRPT
ncbi:hypothetical protein MMC12_007071 [Toensbergia leucococca]|nr:hypothetical protein [Toensbergia leucococca]